jgi:ribose transport system substrate-binding protein
MIASSMLSILTGRRIFLIRAAHALRLGGLLLLSSCTSSRSHRIVLIPETTAQELWETEHAGAEARALNTSWKIYWNGPESEDEIDRQIELVRQAIQQQVGGIVLSPDHAVALTTVVRRALARNIPMVVVGSPLPFAQEERLVQILNDDDASGQMAADRIGTQIHGKGLVAVIGDTPDITSTVQVENAFEHALARSYPGVRIIAHRRGSFRLGESEQQVEEILRASPKLDAILTIGITTTRGTYIALKSQGRASSTRLVACDQDLDLMYYLRRGEIDSVVAQNTYSMGYEAIQSIISQNAIGRQSGVKLVKPFLVTRENIDTSEIQRLLTMNWRPVE